LKLTQEALHLETYLYYYVPKGWKESIGKSLFIPFVTKDDILSIRKLIVPEKFKKYPCFIEAIEKWRVLS
jgi:hypothetical protein